MIDSEWVLKWVPTCEWGPQLVSTGFDSSLKSFSKAVPKIFSGHWLSLWHSNDTILGPSQLSSPDQQVLLRILIPVSHVWLQMDHWDHPLHRPTIILVKDLKIKSSVEKNHFSIWLIPLFRYTCSLLTFTVSHRIGLKVLTSQILIWYQDSRSPRQFVFNLLPIACPPK